MSEAKEFVFHFGGHTDRLTAQLGKPFTVFTEDAFGGRIHSIDAKPRELAPYPWINPLTGPIFIDDVRAGDILAVHFLELQPTRDWGVATTSSNFGLLSGTRVTPNIQAEHDERVWIWKFDSDRRSLTTTASNGATLIAPFRPFHGTVGVAPAHGEVRLSVVPGEFGGNLDLPDIGPGATLYLRTNVDGGHLYVGDGHYSQGDGEITGTGIEGAFNSTMVFGRLPYQNNFDWPRLENDSHIGVIGCARPLDDAVRIATNGLVHWVSSLTNMGILDAYQLVSQACTLRVGNVVNPAFTVLCLIPKKVLECDVRIFDEIHGRLAAKGLHKLTDSPAPSGQPGYSDI